MLNAEKYRSQVLDIIEEGRQFAVSKDRQNIVRCTVDFACENCIFNGKDLRGCDWSRTKWLLSEYKDTIKLTRLEYDILKHLSDNTALMYITRNVYGNVYLFNEEPRKSSGNWYGNGARSLSVLDELFQFVKCEDEKPTSIQDVLKNCEVKEDV